MASVAGQGAPPTLVPGRQQQFELPGYSLPLNWIPHESYLLSSFSADGQYHPVNVPAEGGGRQMFRSALDLTDIEGGWTSLPMTTLREFTMLRLMNHVTDKPNWDVKIFDDHIAAKWKQEALALRDDGVDITQSMVDWCVEELRYKVDSFRKTGCVSVFSGDVVKSDSAISPALKAAFKAAAAPLESVPENQKDYHPGSDGKVLDLVHPSLFPLVYGRTRILKDSLVTLSDCLEKSAQGETIPVPPKEQTDIYVKSSYSRPRYGLENTDYHSRKFQWLPCDVQFVGDKEAQAASLRSHKASDKTTSLSTSHCRITSYINNLHPEKHSDLYHAIEHIIARAIPLWNLSLTPVKARYCWFKRITYDGTEYEIEREEHPDKPVQQDDEPDHAFWDRESQWWEDTKVLVKPEPGKFQPPTIREHLRAMMFDNETDLLKPEYRVDLESDYKDSGLQIIVKLANIELTPEKPNYEGGSWHIEGQLNEHICATALYYYDNENITDSHLAFRQMCMRDDSYDINYEQEDHDWLREIFGCEPHGPCVQEVGDVLCSEDRLLTFPNILQHRVHPFSLKDPTKPGHRKILALFLVDPNIRVISTAHVPPQQRDWWMERVQATGALAQLPAELQLQVGNSVEDFPISMEEAKELRLELMEERKQVSIVQDNNFRSHEFSLCEH